VLRQAHLLHADRRENSAEHSWHLAMLALILAEHSDQPVDMARVIQLVLVHDVVEIDAGDTFAYDVAAQRDKADREQRAAARIFGLLPDDQAAQLWVRWQEFEDSQTAEARFAHAVDRLMPLLHNYVASGPVWRQHKITADQVLAKNLVIAESSTALWQAAQAIIAESVAQGFLAPGDGG
jgi:putative hydrolase of HD superfamily